MEIRCPHCDSALPEADQKYCPKCGIDLPGETGLSRSDMSGRTTLPAEGEAEQTAVDAGLTEKLIPEPAERQPSLRINLPTGDEYVKQITKPQVRLGKGPHNDVVISDPSVSSAHALIARMDDGYAISDLGSRNGTFVNQERVTQPRLLRGGDLINLGRSRLTFQSSEAGDTVALPPRDLALPTLVGVIPGGERIEYAIDRSEIAIGKAPHNQVVVADPTVSSAHAVIVTKGGEYVIVDLGSRNGTYVNGDRVGSDPRTLKHGDTIRIGGTVLTFRNPLMAVESTTALPEDVMIAVSKKSGSGNVDSSDGEVGGSVPRLISAPPATNLTESPDHTSGEAAARPAAPKSADKEKKGVKDKDKDKKKKKKEKDDRLTAAYVGAGGRVVAAVLSVVLTVGIAFYIKDGGLSSSSKPEVTAGRKGKAKLKLGDMTEASPIAGGSFQASGVVQIPGTSRVLFVDNSRPGQVLWMQVDDSGHQVGAAHPVELGVTVEDPEAITYGGSYFYVTGSQSNPKAGASNALVRFSFDSANTTLRGKADLITDMRALLLREVPELKSVSQEEKDAINVEGLTWDPDREQLLLGFRAPLVDGQALIVPLRLRDPLGAFSADNVQFGSSMKLPLGGLGVRDIQYDSRLKSFLIIAGEATHNDKKVFKLWEWDGNPVKGQDESALREDRALDEKIKPEGIARVVIGDRDYLLVVGDAGSFSKIDYSKAEQ
jgi:pSer/pThr/pTyr-binding forkhead associated (FHA) protein